MAHPADTRGASNGALLTAFVETCRRAGSRAAAVDQEAAGADLLRRWSAPDRGYHDVEHLTEVLDRLAEIGDVAVAAPTVLAAWFHDAVYTGRPGDDERASAALARSELLALGAAVEVADRVAALVLVTVDHRPQDDQARALCDADLAILAADAHRYDRYVAGVRREYAHVPHDAFRAGRARVLADLAARGDLFHTDHGRTHWDGAARRNLARELAALREPDRRLR